MKRDGECPKLSYVFHKYTYFKPIKELIDYCQIILIDYMLVKIDE